MATVPVSDTLFSPSGQSFSYIAKNNKLYAIVNKTSPAVINACGSFPAVTAGTFKWPALAFNQPIDDAALPVPLSVSHTAPGSGIWCHEVFFVTTEEGKVFKVNAGNGTVESPPTGVDLRRSGCLNDKIAASAGVQLFDFSNSTFQNNVTSVAGHANDDLVFVITRFDSTCSSGGTKNRVYALWASNLTIKWVFDMVGEFSMGFGSEGCAIDYENNTLYCGTSGGTNTVWAIDTFTGNIIWADNAGPLTARPMVAKDASGTTRIFTASNAAPSVMRKWEPDGDGFGFGVVDWTTSVAGAVQRSIWPESRGTSHSIFVIDTSGNLYRFTDQTTSVVTVAGWPISDSNFIGMPAFAPNVGQVYIGRKDGLLQQIDIATATKQGAVTVGTGVASFISDAGLDIEGTNIDRVLATSTDGFVIRKDISTFATSDNTSCAIRR